MNSNYNSLQITALHRSEHLFTTLAYTYSKALTDFTNGTYNAIDPYNPSRYYGNAEGINFPHALAISATYTFPSLRGKNLLERLALGDWKLAGTARFRSGTSISPGLSVAQQGNAVRPDRILGASMKGPKTFAQYFNTAAFQRPANGYYGNAGTGIITGPGLAVFNLALFKSFRITENNLFEFRAEAFNLFNHTNPSGLSTAYGASNFGAVTSALDPRIMQVSLRYRF